MANTFFQQPYGSFYGSPTGYVPQMGVMPSPTPAMAQATSPLTQQSNFVCRPVTSREEALAVQADFFGMGTLMPDLSHGIIYFKRINQQTGGAEFYEFAVRQPEQEKQPEYVTREEFENFVQSLQPKKKAKQEVSEDE